MSNCRHCGQGAIAQDAAGPVCPDCFEEGYVFSDLPQDADDMDEHSAMIHALAAERDALEAENKKLREALDDAMDEFRREGGKPLEQMEAEMTDTPNKIEEIRVALGWWNDGDPHPLEFLAPDMARIVLAAEKLAEVSVKARNATNNAFSAGTEEREGGSGRRQGKMIDQYEAWHDEMNSALAAYRKAVEGGE